MLFSRAVMRFKWSGMCKYNLWSVPSTLCGHHTFCECMHRFAFLPLRTPKSIPIQPNHTATKPWKNAYAPLWAAAAIEIRFMYERKERHPFQCWCTTAPPLIAQIIWSNQRHYLASALHFAKLIPLQCFGEIAHICARTSRVCFCVCTCYDLGIHTIYSQVSPNSVEWKREKKKAQKCIRKEKLRKKTHTKTVISWERAFCAELCRISLRRLSSGNSI